MIFLRLKWKIIIFILRCVVYVIYEVLVLYWCCGWKGKSKDIIGDVYGCDCFIDMVIQDFVYIGFEWDEWGIDRMYFMVLSFIGERVYIWKILVVLFLRIYKLVFFKI